MASEVVNLRERIEKVRAEMAGESNLVDDDTVKDDNNFVNNTKMIIVLQINPVKVICLILN